VIARAPRRRSSNTVTGFVFDRVEELAASLDRIGELDRAACRRAIEGHFSAERMVRDHLDLFDRLLAT
jgi:hypothetical protein